MQTIICFLLLKSFKPAFLRIFLVLLRYEKEVQLGRYKGVFPSREKIALEAKCSVDRVKQFNQYIRSFNDPNLFQIIKRIDSKTKRNVSNVYIIGKELFELGYKLEALGYFKKWKEIKEDLCSQISENENFINDRYASYKQSITRGFCQKLPAIKDSSIKEVYIRVPEPTGSSAFILNYGLSEKTLRFAENHCSRQAVLYARNDFDWYRKTHDVRSKDGLMIYCLKNQIVQQAQKFPLRKNAKMG